MWPNAHPWKLHLRKVLETTRLGCVNETGPQGLWDPFRRGAGGGGETSISASGLLELLSFTVASVQKILSQYPPRPPSLPFGDSGTTAISTGSPLTNLRA